MDATTMSIISGIFLLLTFVIVGWRAARRDKAKREQSNREEDASP